MVKQGYKQTEIGVIPEDWEVMELKDIASIVGGGTPKTNIISYWKDDINWFTPTELGNCKFISESIRKISYEGLRNSSAKLLPKGTILLTTRASIGDTAILLNEATTNQGFQSLIVNNNTSNEYIYYLIETLKPQLLQNASGSTFLEISPNKVKNIQIPLPPLPEQEAIAEALSDADAWIESLEQLIAKKRLIKQGAMQELLTPPSTSSGNADGEALEPWEVKKLGEVADFRRGSFPQPYGLDKWYDDTNGMPFIQVFDVAKNRKLKLDTKSKISALAQPMSVFVPKGTVVLTIQGSIGRIALTQYDAYCDRTLLIFQRIDTSLDKFFFLLQVEQIFEIEKEKAPGGTIKTITKEALSDFDISFPKSLSEQERIAMILSDMDAELEALEKQLGKARQIKQGMMQELLTGKTRLIDN